MKNKVITFYEMTIDIKEIKEYTFSLKFNNDKTLPFSFVKFAELVQLLLKQLPEYEYLYFEDDNMFNFMKFSILKNGSIFKQLYEVVPCNGIKYKYFKQSKNILTPSSRRFI